MFILTTTYAKKIKSVFCPRLLVIFCVLLVSSAHADNNEGKVALIAAKGSGIEVMPMREIRRLYLGFKSASSVSVKNPVLNVQSKALYDEFLKNTMHMTEGSYKRKLVKRMFRQGSVVIPELASLKRLNEHLQKNIGDISFVEISSVEKMNNIEVIQILW